MRVFTFSLVALVCVASALRLHARQSSRPSAKDESSISSQVIEFTSAGGYPELHVGGKPFFIHAAYFDYFSIPRDLWEQSLDSYHDFAINTIALRIPWNWHEQQEGAFDFDGHSNPRRDLRGLMRLIVDKGFKLIVAPGPVFDSSEFSDWRDAGRPDWVVPQNLTSDSEKWVAAVAQELQRRLSAADSSPSATPPNASSELLYVVFDDPAQKDAAAPDQSWSTAAELRDSMISAGLRAHFLINAVLPAGARAHAASSEQLDPAGRWLLMPARTSPASSASLADPLVANTTGPLKFLLGSLRLESSVQPVVATLAIARHSESNVAPTSEVADLYLAWAYQVAHGAGGIAQSGFQRTMPPPGYLVQDSSRHADDHAILDLSGTSLRVAEREHREADLVNRLGSLFASSHPRSVLGVIDLRAGDDYADSVSAAARAQAAAELNLALPRILRVADLAGIPAEFADPGSQAAQPLSHNPVLLLSIPESLRSSPFLSSAAQQSLLEFVRAGGSLICEPEIPAGGFAEALGSVAALSAGDGIAVRNLEKGRVISWSKDFYSWVNLEEDVAASRQRTEAAWSVENLRTLIKEQSASLPILRGEYPADSLDVSEIAPNTATAGASAHAQGLLSVVNWSDTSADETIRVLPPSGSVREAAVEDYTELPIALQPRDALFLPLDAPLCNASPSPETCGDRVVAAGAELVNFAREGKTLELTFYAPTKATIILHLDAPPHRVELLERNLDGTYNVGAHTFTVQLPRGAAPGFLRTLKFDMPYTPHVLEAPKPERKKIHDFRASIVNAMRYPLGEGASLATYPALVPLDPHLDGRIMLHVENLGDSSLTVHADVSGAVTGSRTIRLEAKERNDYAIDLHAGDSAKLNDDGLLHATLHLSGADRAVDLPLDLISRDPEAISHYQVDFQRSGSKSWVLENDSLRVIVAPAFGGTLASLVDTQSETDLLFASGGFFDSIRDPDSAELHDLTLNTTFETKWLAPEKDSGLITGISLTGATPAGSTGSIQITKQIRVLSSTKLGFTYAAQTASASGNFPSLITGFAIPAFPGPAGTQFCWSDSASPTSPEASASHCESFTPSSGGMTVPENLQRIEIHDHNRTVMVFECQSGFITIDQQNSSARILWNLPPIESSRASSAGSPQPSTATLTLGDNH